LAGQDGVDGGVRVVVGDGIHATEFFQIVFVRDVVATVGDAVEGREALVAVKQFSPKFGEHVVIDVFHLWVGAESEQVNK